MFDIKISLHFDFKAPSQFDLETNLISDYGFRIKIQCVKFGLTNVLKLCFSLSDIQIIELYISNPNLCV